jgi:hypothetical protein
MTVVSGLQKEYSSKPNIQVQLKRIFALLRTYNSSLITQYIRSADNQAADQLSRANLGDAYRLNKGVFQAIAACVDGLDIDRFATHTNTLLPRFNSYFYEPGTMGVDAFAQDNWLENKNYCNPPISVLNRLVKFLRDFEPRFPPTVVIAPLWVQ